MSTIVPALPPPDPRDPAARGTYSPSDPSRLARGGAIDPARDIPGEASGDRALMNAAFQGLAQVPPEAEWFANLGNPGTKRAYQLALTDFMTLIGIDPRRPEEFRIVTRAHVIAWRDELVRLKLEPATIRNRLSALSSLFEYLCEKNAVTHNPVKGVKRPKADNH